MTGDRPPPAPALSLIPPDPAWRASFRDLVAAFHAVGEDWPHGACSADRRALADLKRYALAVRREAEGRDLPPGAVPCSTWWIRLEDPSPIVVGTATLRHRLAPWCAVDGGHVAYCVDPRRRGRGIATAALGRVLEAARGLGLARLLLTCDEGNPASARVIERRGGRFESAVPSPRRPGARVRRYWISLEEARA